MPTARRPKAPPASQTKTVAGSTKAVAAAKGGGGERTVLPVDALAYTYRHSQLPEGAVLVVGAGSSGAQIADELVRAGKRVYLSVGPHDRPPRAGGDRRLAVFPQ